ncbi:MAG: hypothetical protein WDW38_002524 [Sanguina aurantia]
MPGAGVLFTAACTDRHLPRFCQHHQADGMQADGTVTPTGCNNPGTVLLKRCPSDASPSTSLHLRPLSKRQRTQDSGLSFESPGLEADPQRRQQQQQLQQRQVTTSIKLETSEEEQVALLNLCQSLDQMWQQQQLQLHHCKEEATEEQQPKQQQRSKRRREDDLQPPDEQQPQQLQSRQDHQHQRQDQQHQLRDGMQYQQQAQLHHRPKHEPANDSEAQHGEGVTADISDQQQTLLQQRLERWGRQYQQQQQQQQQRNPHEQVNINNGCWMLSASGLQRRWQPQGNVVRLPQAGGYAGHA